MNLSKVRIGQIYQSIYRCKCYEEHGYKNHFKCRIIKYIKDNYYEIWVYSDHTNTRHNYYEEMPIDLKDFILEKDINEFI